MRAKAKPLRDLFFRFGEATNLNWSEVAKRLHQRKLIELLPDKSGEAIFSYYRDTDELRDRVKSGETAFEIMEVEK